MSLHKAELIKAQQTVSESDVESDDDDNINDNDSHLPINHPAAFSFPCLSPDGSVDDLAEFPTRRFSPTPPAALSSLAAKLNMAGRDSMANSVSSFADSSYDMVDDVSDFSTDDHDTASLLSVEDVQADDGHATPEETGSIVNIETGRSEGHGPAAQPEEPAEKQSASDSILSDDLETPRQSTIDRAHQSHYIAGRNFLRVDSEDEPTPSVPVEKISTKTKSKTEPSAEVLTTSKLFFIIVQVLAVCLAWIWFAGASLSQTPYNATTARKEALTLALGKVINSTDASRVVNVDHLLPTSTPVSAGRFGQPIYSPSTDARFDYLLPNHMIIALPQRPGSLSSPSSSSVRVHKADRELAFNCTKLIDGVYDVSFDPDQAFGMVTVNMMAKNPVMNVTAEHDFGHRLLQKKTYQQAGTELSKSMNKELSVMTESARSFKEMIEFELNAGVAATKNVTAQLAVHISQDLTRRAKSAASMVTMIGKGCNDTAAVITKELMTVQNEVVKVAKRSIRLPLKTSMNHARSFRDQVAGRNKAAKSKVSTSKELSTHFQDLFDSFKPRDKLQKFQKTVNRIRCLPKSDFAACKKAQDKSLSLYSMTSSLSTVPGQGVKTKSSCSKCKATGKCSGGRAALRSTLQQTKSELEKNADCGRKRSAKQKESLEKRMKEQRAATKKSKGGALKVEAMG